MDFEQTRKMQQLLQQAVTLHKQGNLRGAELLYADVLRIQPAQFDALHLSGVIARQRGDAEAAVDLIARAIQVDPAQAVAHCNLGAALQDSGRPQDALLSYDRAIALNPNYAMAFNNRGNALKNLGRLDDALHSYNMALHLSPAYVEALGNLGITLHLMQRYTEALASFDHALHIKPDYSEVMYSRGVTLHSLQRYAEAILSYDRVLDLRPEHVEAVCGRGTALQRLHRYDEALAAYDHALRINPAHAPAHKHRGNTLRSLTRPGEAIEAYQHALENGADPVPITYALASLGVGAVPSASPVAYVKELFDQYAEHFDQHLVEVLRYDMPRVLSAQIAQHIGAAPLVTLDLGCGTGLCGPHLRPYSRTLTGVDVSQNMLNKAAQRGLYDHLACAELTEFLSDRTNAYDLIVAADVFVYIGDLDPVFARVKSALRAGGIFSFSVEAAQQHDYTLRTTNRYAHSLRYLETLAQKYGYDCKENEAISGRQDHGEDIVSFAILLRAA